MVLIFDQFDLNRHAQLLKKSIDGVEMNDLNIGRRINETLHIAEVVLYTDGNLFKVLKNHSRKCREYVMYSKYTKGEILELLLPRHNRNLSNEELTDLVAGLSQPAEEHAAQQRAEIEMAAEQSRALLLSAMTAGTRYRDGDSLTEGM